MMAGRQTRPTIEFDGNGKIDADGENLSADVNRGRKRRLSASGDETASLIVRNKKIHLSDEVQSPPDDGNKDALPGRALLDFSDEILLSILINCNSTLLHDISKTCRRLQRLVQDHVLWKTFDFSKRRLSAREIKARFGYLCAKTKHFLVRGFTATYPLAKWKNSTITPHMLLQLAIQSPALESMTVYDGYLDLNRLAIRMFPGSLKRLHFIGCQATSPRPMRWFNQLEELMPHLVEISMEHCPWFDTHDVLVFSKLPNLEKLSLRGCLNLRDFVPYGSISARFGFKKLHTLDVRRTGITDSDLQCFNIVYSLRELLMECPGHLIVKSDDNSTAEEMSSDEDDGKNGSDFEDDTADPYKIPSDCESILSSEDDCSENESDDSDDDDDAQKPENKAASSEQAAQPNQKIISVSLLGNNRDHTLGDIALEQREISGIRCFVGVLNSGVPLTPAVDAAQQDQAGPSSSQANAGPATQAATTPEAAPSAGTVRFVRTTEQRPETAAQASSASSTEPQPSTSRTTANEPQQSAATDSASDQRHIIIIQPRLDNNGNAAAPLVHEGTIPWDGEARRAIANSVAQIFTDNRTTEEEDSPRSISDRGILAFGMARENMDDGIVWILGENQRPDETQLEVILLRNYRSVTDRTLRHLEIAAPNLRYLDVTGTGVTSRGLRRFMAAKPNCVVISSKKKQS